MARRCYFVFSGGLLLGLCARLLALLVAGLGLCRRRPGVVPATIVPIVLVSTLSWQLGAGAAPLFFFLFFGGLLIVFRDEARARYEKFCERRPWFGRHVAPRVEKLSAGVAALFRRHVAPRVESLKKKQAVVALLEKLSVAVTSLRDKLTVAAPLAWKGLKKGTARIGRCLYCGCCGRCGEPPEFWRRLLVKRPPAAVYTAEDGTEQTVPWVVAPGPPGTKRRGHGCEGRRRRSQERGRRRRPVGTRRDADVRPEEQRLQLLP